MKEDAITYAEKINRKIDEIDKLVDRTEDLGNDKATALANYDRMVALTTIKVKSGIIVAMEDTDGSMIDIPKNISAVERTLICKGICWEEKLEQEGAEALYKSNITIIDAKKAQLNGLQSINKVLQ